MSETIESVLQEHRVFHASDTFKTQSQVSPALYESANQDRLQFWESQASELHWFQRWDKVLQWDRPFAKWFINGKLNASYNCLDVHLTSSRKDKTAILWEGEDGEVRKYTYAELHREVCQLADQLVSRFKIKKGDRITLYMPMVPELAISVLACARIGAIHSVVFGGFSASSLRDRIQDSSSRLLITADGGYRRGKVIPLKEIADTALADTPGIESVIVLKRTGEKCHWESGRDVDYHEVIASGNCNFEAAWMDSEDPLFILYTSGTTGKPKGILHTTGGYMTHAAFSTKVVFDLKESDVYWCTADIGWITGHTYLVYGPLANGATTVMFEGTPDYPEKDRFWELIARHKVSILYTAPTAIRAFMKWGDAYPAAHDLSTLRLLGTVGEPINPEAWVWYHHIIGNGNCPVVDTWWQTETGGIMISNLPALNVMKPGSAGLPLPGISAQILDSDGNAVSQGGGLLSLTEPWPSMLRGIWGDNERYKDVYWGKFDSYFAGDGATIDQDGYFRVLGRVDDVLNVAGHRIGTMEIESTLVEVPKVAEAAVVGVDDEIKGQAIVAYVILKEGVSPSADLEKALIDFVSQEIGAIAKPKEIIFTPELPKTRSGKIMRRICQKIASRNSDVGDTTTLANPEIVDYLIKKFNSR